MNVMFISQCNKRALTETRRILDQFAERRGVRSWQTAISKDGLDTVRKLLRQSARKNTAVACHWIRGLDHSELLWVVGDQSQFGPQGAVPTNSTEVNVLRQLDENDWHSNELIRLLADMAGLMHDLGKSIDAFQDKLRSQAIEKNRIRHEWVSLRLFEAFVGEDSDADWLARLANPSDMDDSCWIARLHRDGLDANPASPFRALAQAPLAQALGWLIVTHHRLPVRPRDGGAMPPLAGILRQLGPTWNEANFDATDGGPINAYWQFKHGLPVTHAQWRKRAGRIAQRLLDHVDKSPNTEPLNNPFVMHISRLCLMLADHHYSGLQGQSPERFSVVNGGPLIANTFDGRPNQTLSEHLLGVAQLAAELARFLPRFDQHLPRLAQHRALRRRSKDARFRWQDRAAELAGSVRAHAQDHGAFVVNMASTGCGKTLGNARIMYALADPARGMRCAFAMGLRTLTLQTGRAFRDLLGLGDDELAIRVGGAASRALFEHHEAEAERSGSASRQDLIDEDGHVVFEGATDTHPLLKRALANPNIFKLIHAPVLVSTIDHLTPATESLRGGRQIAPMLRLMSSDLVLDEPDDFDLADLPALTRLVHWAGLLGARVLLSSATLAPALVQGLFEAYRDGRSHFQRNRGARPGAGDAAPHIDCIWVDEFKQDARRCATAEQFEAAHGEFAAQRYDKLAGAAAETRRRAVLAPLSDLPTERTEAAQRFASQVMNAAIRLHQLHAGTDPTDPAQGKRVSFGLVRMANIEPLIDTALALFAQGAPDGCRIHLCVYHSQFPMLVRSAIEQQLDAALDRHDPDTVFALAPIRRLIDSSPEQDQLFIVLGSPVTEVGRDHDYDWAVVEPSSMRSLIQLAGRVRRHRPGACTAPNIEIFESNLRHFRRPDGAAFVRPGFETETGAFRLSSHSLSTLLRTDECDVIDARARIVARPSDQFDPHTHLADLEHARLRNAMLASATASPMTRTGRRHVGPVQLPINATSWWREAPRDATTTGLLQREQPFRDARGQVDIELAMMPEDEDSPSVLHWVQDPPGHRRRGKLYVPVGKELLQTIPDDAVNGPRIAPWGVTDYDACLNELAEAMDMPPETCAKRFGVVSLPENEGGWRFHPALGFSRATG